MVEKSKQDQCLKVLPSPKWVRVFLGGQAVADSRQTLLLRAHGQLAVYYFPSQDVRMEWLKPAAQGSPVTEQGEGPWPDPPQPAKIYTVRVGDIVAENAAWHVEEPTATHPELAGHVAFAWQAMDACGPVGVE